MMTGRGEVGGGEDAVHVELLVEDGFESSDDDRQVLRLAAGHDGVDRDLLDGERARGSAGTSPSTSWASRFVPREHAQDALRRRRDDGQAIGEALVEHELEEVVGFADFDAAGAKGTAFGLGREALGDAGFDRFRAAARAHLRVGGPVDDGRGREGGGDEPGEERLPVGLAEADEAFELFARGVGEDDGRDGIEVVGEGDVRAGVVEHRRGGAEALDEVGVAFRVLADGPHVHGLAEGFGGGFDQRHGEHAGRAVLLHETEQGRAAGGERASRCPRGSVRVKAGSGMPRSLRRTPRGYVR